MWNSNEYNTRGDGCRNEKPGKSTPSTDTGLALNMQFAATTHPSISMNFMSDPFLYHHPQHRTSINFGGGHDSCADGRRLLFDNSTATTNQIASVMTSFANTTGGGMQKMVFTASQLQEFENQAMIYNHIISSNPIPPQLLLPLSTQYNRSADSEPWRCRRTDGKKWRCSRDVMPDQKYCERHAHKNRPRSRKPVETQSQNTKKLDDNENYHSILHPATNVPTSCQQSRCTEWFMRGGTTHQTIQKPMVSSSVGSKRDHFFQNLEGSYEDLVEGDSCSLTLMQPGGDYTCVDQDQFQMGARVLNEDDSNPQNQLVHQGRWLGGPLGEALCPGVVSIVSSPNDSSHGPWA